jgi:NAD(P)-dependent dehydrogenase (short-subunit alcohol dehydrogenase family)
MDLKNKVVLVTGGAIGIGEAIVREFAKNGSTVVVNYNRSKKEAEKLVVELEADGVSALAVKADVSNEEEIGSLFDQVVQKFGSVDVLINNAGYSTGEDFLKGTRKLWLDQLTNNFLSVVSCSQKFLEINKGKTDKKIINISSIYGFGGVGDSGFMQYCASKAAVNNFTENLAKFSGPVLVNAIAPGYVWTPQWYEISKEEKDKFGENLVIKRFIEPNEIADGVIFLAKNDAITGEKF